MPAYTVFEDFQVASSTLSTPRSALAKFWGDQSLPGSVKTPGNWVVGGDLNGESIEYPSSMNAARANG